MTVVDVLVQTNPEIFATVTGGTPGPPGPSGTSVNIVGSVPNAADLPDDLGPDDAGDGSLTDNDGHLHVWDGDSWTDVGSIQGPPGSTGPAGPIGATGPAGAAGTPGSTGPAGAQGPKGDKGDTGAQGIQGVQGVTGAQGNPGTPGATGSQGPQGNPGTAGAQGPAGPGVPPGGTINQVLGKTSNADYATSWRDDVVGSGGGGGITTEDAVDAVAAALVAGNNIDVTYNDAANTITIDVEPLVTGDIAGLDTALTGKADAAATTTALAGKQPIDADLTAIAALAQANGSVIQSNGTAWVAATPATVKTSLALTKADVGLSAVDNTADASKPVSTAQAAADALAAPKTTTIATTAPLSGGGDLSANRTLTLLDGGVTNTKLANAAASTFKGNNTGAAAVPVDMTVAQAKTLLALSKSDVGLANVDNTSDSTKNSAAATLTNKTIALGSNTVTGTLAQLNTAISDADVPAALNGLTGIWIGTQAQYTALGTYVGTVLYAITP